MLVVEGSFWWSKDGYYPFEPGTDHYPHPGQVVWYFRKQTIIDGIPCTQANLAKALALSEKSVWSMENSNVGLDSFHRRVLLVTLLNIPPVLLKLDASYLSNTQEYPRPGQVVRSHRKMKKKDSITSWVQADLAKVLGLSEKSVRAMENHDLGLDSLTRRELLIAILDIPPALLGLDALHRFVRGSQVFKLDEPRLPRHVTLNQEKLTRYGSLIPSYWDAHYTGSTSFKAVEKIIHTLRSMVAYVTENQQEQIKKLLCHYHQLASDIARDQGDLGTALAHAHLAITLAENTDNNELMAAALYRKGLIYFDLRNLSAAANDLDDALPFARSARPQLKGMVYMEAGRFRAHLAQSSIDQVQACRLLDQTENIVRQGQLEEDECYVNLDRGRYHIGRAATFIALHRPSEALEELDDADRLTKPEYIRRHAYIDILRARAYFVQKQFDFATDLASDALSSCLAINSECNIADITELHNSLAQTSFSNSPTVVQLGLMLGSRK